MFIYCSTNAQILMKFYTFSLNVLILFLRSDKFGKTFLKLCIELIIDKNKKVIKQKDFFMPVKLYEVKRTVRSTQIKLWNTNNYSLFLKLFLLFSNEWKIMNSFKQLERYNNLNYISSITYGIWILNFIFCNYFILFKFSNKLSVFSSFLRI
jgi:hypothetical protein